jgi:hypothetical protein
MLVGLLSFSGCSALKSSQGSSSPSSTTNSTDTKTYRVLAHELERQLLTCGRDASCDRIHFTSALLALHDKPAGAASHFRTVITQSPKSELANLSTAWLEFLETPTKRDGAAVVTHTAQWLLFELRARDRKVEELSRQLKALKQVNLEMKENSYLIKPRIKPMPETDMKN